jgi:aromatic-L-amino-acid decarboxylase
MDLDEFKKQGHELIDWIVNYYKNIESYPVKARSKAGEVLEKLPLSAPVNGESFENIFNDFEKIVMPAISHWQHPRFFAYFPSNTSFPSLLAEMIVSALGLQCMSWETSPAATEMEERMMEWLRDILGFPKSWTGVIQDTASTSTLLALLTAREKITQSEINKKGFYKEKTLRVYASEEAHSSIEKAAKVLGYGSENYIKIPTDNNLSMRVDLLEAQILSDKKNNFLPTAVVVALGTTSTTSFDDLAAVSKICHKENV